MINRFLAMAIEYPAAYWKDYALLDSGNGEKLERWGKFILVRPDPQVIWQTDHKNPGWKNANGHYHRSSKGGGEWEFKGLPETLRFPLEAPHF